MNASPVVTSLFKYKAWANDQFLTAMQRFDAQAQGTERHNAIRILNHTYVVDRIFAANLQRQRHEYTATNTTDTPTLDQLGAESWPRFFGQVDKWNDCYIFPQ